MLNEPYHLSVQVQQHSASIPRPVHIRNQQVVLPVYDAHGESSRRQVPVYHGTGRPRRASHGYHRFAGPQALGASKLRHPDTLHSALLHIRQIYAEHSQIRHYIVILQNCIEYAFIRKHHLQLICGAHLRVNRKDQKLHPVISHQQAR